MKRFEHYAWLLILVFSIAVQLEAVTVNPLAPMCPTNKVAPRRKRGGYEKIKPRTFGEFYNLLAPDSPSSLQEKPQADAADDCGEIEDYDENDVSSVTPQATRRQGHNNKNLRRGSYDVRNRFYFQGMKASTVPPSRATRPPPAGYFGTNNYTPQKPQEPTAYVKPVNEPGHDPQIAYRPGALVGVLSGHVVGLPQKQPSIPPSDTKASNRKPKNPNHAYSQTTVHSNANARADKHHRQRKYNGDTGIIGSFVDLFF